MTTWRPRGKRYLLQPHTSEQVSKGGIYIPDESRQEQNYGTVLAAGDQADVSLVGRDVMFTTYSGVDFEERDPESGERTKYRIIEEDDLIADK